MLLADITKQAHGSFIFGADTVALGPVGFNSMRASIVLASPTSGQFSASLLSQSGVKTDLAGNITRLRDTTVVRLDSANVLVDADNRYRLLFPTRVAYSPGFLTLDSLLLQHSSNARLAIENVRMNGDSIKGHVRTDSVDMRVFRAFMPGLVDARGAIVADVDIRGSVKQPQLFGQISIGDGFARFSNLGTTYDHIKADIALAGDTVHIKTLSAETMKERRGTLSVTGSVSFEHYDNPSFSLTANASNFHAIDKPGLAALDVSTGPAVTLTGSTQAAVMRGTLRVERGSIYIPEVVKKQIIDLEDPEFQSAVDTLLSQNREVMPRAPRAVARNLRLENVNIDIGSDVWLRSSEANIKLGGSLAVTLAPPNPNQPPQLALEGFLSADRGTYRLNLVDPFIQPTFDVQSGSLRFSGTPDLESRARHHRDPHRASANEEHEWKGRAGGSGHHRDARTAEARAQQPRQSPVVRERFAQLSGDGRAGDWTRQHVRTTGGGGARRSHSREYSHQRGAAERVRLHRGADGDADRGSERARQRGSVLGVRPPQHPSDPRQAAWQQMVPGIEHRIVRGESNCIQGQSRTPAGVQDQLAVQRAGGNRTWIEQYAV